MSQEEEMIAFERQTEVLVPVVLATITFTGVVANILVLLTTVVYRKKFGTIYHILIANLALADLLFVVFCVPGTGVSLASTTWVLSEPYCKISNFLFHACYYVRVFTIVILSVDSYVVIVHPFASESVRQLQYILAVIISLWGLALLGNSPLLHQYEVLVYTYFEDERSVCINILELQNPNVKKVFYGFLFFAGFILPLLIIGAMFGMLALYLLSAEGLGSGRKYRTVQSKKRNALIVLVVTILFYVCWTPAQTTLMVKAYGSFPGTITAARMNLAFICLSYVSFVINPIVYACLSVQYRHAYYRLLTCKGKQHMDPVLQIDPKDKTIERDTSV